MRYVISGKNIDVTEGLRTAITDKLGKLERYFTPDTEVHVTLSVEKERQKIEVTIPVKGTVIRSEQVSNDMYVSIDLVEEVIERQLRKYKNKIVQREQGAGSFRQEFIDKEAEDILSDARRRALQNEERIVAQAKEEAGRILARAQEEARLEKQKMSDEIKQEIVSVASVMAGKLVGASIDTARQNSLIEETLKEMGEDTWQN